MSESTLQKAFKKARHNPKRVVVGQSRRWVIRPFDRVLGSVIFGNRAGMKKNLQGINDIKKASANSNLSKDVANEDQISRLQTQGYLDLGRPYPEETIEQIQNKYENLIEDEIHSVVRAEYDGEVYSRIIPRAFDRIPEFKGLLTDEIKDIIKAYFDSHFRVGELICWRNYHVPQRIIDEASSVFSDHWHSDPRRSSCFKLFVNLSEVTSDDGPFHLLPKPETKRLAKKRPVRWYERGELREVLDGSDDVVRAIGPAGTGIFCNTVHCLHRAGFPSEGRKRDIIQFKFYPSSEPLADDWLSKIPPKEI